MATPLTTQQLTEIEARVNDEHLTPGPWTLDRESCDCSDGYCRHGAYVTGVVTPVPTEIAAERLARTGEQPRDYDFHRSDIGDFTDADWELMAHARTDVPALVAEVRRLTAELDRAREDLDFIGRTTLPDLRHTIQHHEDGKRRWRERAEKAEARVAELERPAVEAKRNEIRDSYQQPAADAERDRDYEGRDHALNALAAREEQWKREDATQRTTPA